MIRAFRALRRLARKALKPVCLLIIVRQYKDSEDEIVHLEALRQESIRRMQREHARQVKLQVRRNQVAGW